MTELSNIYDPATTDDRAQTATAAAREAGAGFSVRRRQGPWRDPLLRRMLAVADVTVAILLCVALVFFPGGGLDTGFWASVFVPAWVLLAKLHGLYDRDQRALRHLTVDELPTILVWSLSSVAATGVFLWLTPAGAPSAGAAVTGWVIVVASAVVLRSFARFAWRQIVPHERVLVVGSGPLADATRRKLELFPDIHINVAAQVDEEQVGNRTWAAELPHFDRVILASQAIDEPLIADLIALCRREGMKLSVVPPARGMFGTAVRLTHVADLPVVEYHTWDVSRSTLLLKRVMDLAVSLPALVVLAPFFALIAVAIRLDSRGPVFFRQLRAGLGGKPFRVFKFRTMVVNAEAEREKLVRLDDLRDPVIKLRRDPRVTRVGRLLRRFSLDELPQLINVARGDMSLVGPRPELVELVDRWPPAHRFRLSVKPGMTGPMQVFGRSELRFDEWLAVERDYIENVSLGRDLRILALTLPTVFTGRGAF